MKLFIPSKHINVSGIDSELAHHLQSRWSESLSAYSLHYKISMLPSPLWTSHFLRLTASFCRPPLHHTEHHEECEAKNITHWKQIVQSVCQTLAFSLGMH